MSQLRSPLAEARTGRPFSRLLTVVAALAVIGTMVGATLPAQASAASTRSAAAAPAAPAGVLSFSQAKAEGKVGSINWGSRCNVPTGTLKYPSFFAAACYAPFTGTTAARPRRA